MSIKISYKKGINEKKIKNFVLFSDQEFMINGLRNLSLAKNSNQIIKTINSNKSKNKDFLSFNINTDQKIILIKIKDSKSSTENEKKGAIFYNFSKLNSLTNLTFLDRNIYETQTKNHGFLEEFLHGMQLKSYEFNKYKTKKEMTDINIDIIFKTKIPNKIKSNRFLPKASRGIY